MNSLKVKCLIQLTVSNQITIFFSLISLSLFIRIDESFCIRVTGRGRFVDFSGVKGSYFRSIALYYELNAFRICLGTCV